jgi:hypothetical protein
MNRRMTTTAATQAAIPKKCGILHRKNIIQVPPFLLNQGRQNEHWQQQNEQKNHGITISFLPPTLKV